MIPDWMTKNEDYTPPKDGGAFYYKTMRSLGRIMARLRIEGGREGRRALPAALKIFLVLAFILVVALTRDRLILMGLGAVILMVLATRPAEVIWSVAKPALAGALLTAVLYGPAVLWGGGALGNGLVLILKVAMSIISVGLLNRTTQWNHLTGALRKLHVPGVVVFILDMTFRYIVLLGKLMDELLTAVSLRSVGKNNKKYSSVGGVMGVTFLRGAEMNQEMYEAMQCRGFTDDYKGL